MPRVNTNPDLGLLEKLKDYGRRLRALEMVDRKQADDIRTGDPVGQLIWRALPGVPQGWLLANGQQVTTAYPILRAELVAAGNPHGSGGGNPLLPNYIDKFPRGKATPGGTGGADSVAITIPQMPSHTHTQNPHSHGNDPHSHPVGTNGQYFIVNGTGGAGGDARIPVTGGGYNQATPQPVGISIHNATATNQNTGSGQAHENRPPFVDAVPLIRAY